MNRKTVFVFHMLMKRGWIDRREDAAAWEAYQEPEVQTELHDFGDELGFDLWRTGDRLYLVPTQDNDLFLKNNVDYRRDIKANNEVRMRDIYLLNYMAVYLLYVFFSGDGNDPRARDFMTKEDITAAMATHCEAVTKTPLEDSQNEYSENFRKLAEDWLSKLEGEPEDTKMNTRYGCLNRLLYKLRADDLFTEQQVLRPTQKLCDLMPYFLRKDRIARIREWVAAQKEDEHAADQ